MLIDSLMVYVYGQLMVVLIWELTLDSQQTLSDDIQTKLVGCRTLVQNNEAMLLHQIGKFTYLAFCYTKSVPLI